MIFRERKENCFISHVAKLLLWKLEDAGNIKFKNLIEEDGAFYGRYISYCFSNKVFQILSPKHG
jgi:hypothetical protein